MLRQTQYYDPLPLHDTHAFGMKIDNYRRPGFPHTNFRHTNAYSNCQPLATKRLAL